MHIHDITYDDMSNGTGLRVVLWVSGCNHKCVNCHNPQTWSCDSGIPFTEWEEAELFEKIGKEHIEGVTFSGGDPMHENNRASIGILAKNIKRVYPDKTIWLYTGYTLKIDDSEFIFTDEAAGLDSFSVDWLSYIDVIVDGRYDDEQRKKDLMYKNDVTFRGSSNQRYINMKESLKYNEIRELAL